MELKRIKPTNRLSQAVVAGGLVFTVGQVAEGAPGKSVTLQVQDILQRIDSLLLEAGTSKKNLVSATIYLADISYFDEMNSVWDAWVIPGSTPARATIQATLLSDDFSVEIAIVAAA